MNDTPQPKTTDSDVILSGTEFRRMLANAERMRTALNLIRVVAEQSVFGSWRFKVAALVDEGLRQ